MNGRVQPAGEPPSSESAPRTLESTLAREAAELDARLAEMEALAMEQRALEVELDELRDARRDERRRALPLLGETRSAGACTMRFDACSGDGRVRRCARCDHELADPRKLDGDRVRALLGRARGALFVRPDGTIMTRECPEAARRRSVHRTVGLVVSLLLVLFVSRTVAYFTPPPAAALQYLSARSRVGRSPSRTHWVPIAPRAHR